MEILVISVIIFLLLFYLMYIYVVKAKNKVLESMSDIDVQLKKRYDLIPNMLQLAAKFMEHEKNLMLQLAEIRTKALASSFITSPKEKIELEKLFDAKLHEFKVSLENYPDLKSNQTMITAMQSMNEVEEHIAAARRFYNSNVTALKNIVEIFPLSFIASFLKIDYKQTPFFEVSENEKQSINSAEYFK